MRDQPGAWIDDTVEPEGSRRRSGLLLATAGIPWLVVVALLVLPGRLGGVNGPAPTTPDPAYEADGTPQPGSDVPGAGDEADGGEADGDPAGTDAARGGREAGDGGGVGPDAPGGAAVDGPDADASAETPTDPSAPVPGQDGTTSTLPLWLSEHRGRWRAEPGSEEAAALAIAVARAWLTGLGPPLDVDGVPLDADTRYAEHLVVEAVEQPAPEAAVVTLLAIVLEGDEELQAGVRRLAVPIAWEPDGPRPAGPPWWLPGPNLDPLVPATEPIEDPDEHLAVAEALAAAGLQDVDVRGLGRTSGWPVIAEVSARTAGGERIEGPVWLRRHVDGYVVSGTTTAPIRTDAGGGAEQEP